jgi:serine/threonine-protein kinase
MTGRSVPGFADIRKLRDDPVGRRVLARHRVSRRLVHVTYLSPEFLADAEFRCRFAADAARHMRVREDRVARLHRYVERDEWVAVVADRVAGTPLRDVLLDEGALGTDAALVVFKDALRALAAGQAAGVAHGDLKPEDLILTGAGDVRLVDFGLYTGPGRRLFARATPFYLAPELWSDSAATTAGDLYTATATFFECLVGAPPFHAADADGLRVLHRDGLPPLDAVAGPVRQLLRAGLAKDPDQRPGPVRLITQIEETAVAVRGAGWERHGRSELSRLLNQPAGPQPLPVARRGAERRQPVRLAAALGGAMALAAGLSSPMLPNGVFRLPTGDSGGQNRPPVMAFPGPADNAELRTDIGQGSRAGTAAGAEPAAPVLLAQPAVSLPPAGQRQPQAVVNVAQSAADVSIRPVQDLSVPAPRSMGHEAVAPQSGPSPAELYRSERAGTPAPRQAGHDGACATSDSPYQDGRPTGGRHRLRTDGGEPAADLTPAQVDEPPVRTYSSRTASERPRSEPVQQAPRSTADHEYSAGQPTGAAQQPTPEQLAARQSAAEKIARSGRTTPYPAGSTTSGTDGATTGAGSTPSESGTAATDGVTSSDTGDSAGSDNGGAGSGVRGDGGHSGDQASSSSGHSGGSGR